MQLITVDSSMVHAVGYDPDTQELEVIFNSGRIYRYSGVPRAIYEGLLAAESKGQYMLANVIDRFPYRPFPLRRRG